MHTETRSLQEVHLDLIVITDRKNLAEDCRSAYAKRSLRRRSLSKGVIQAKRQPVKECLESDRWKLADFDSRSGLAPFSVEHAASSFREISVCQQAGKLK